METTYYNIHNTVKINIQTKRTDLIEEYDYHLRNFKTQIPINNPDLTILDLDRFSLPQECFNISNSFYGFKNGFYDKKKQYAVQFQEGGMVLYVKENNLSINAILQLILLPQGATFVHGAGISFKNQGIIFPAPPNTGKTLLMSALTKMQDVKFFGDDYLLVKKSGEMLVYPADFSVYKYHFDFFEELQGSQEEKKIKRDFFERMVVRLIKDMPIKYTFKKIARFFKYDYLKGGEFLKIPADRLLPRENFGYSAKLQHVVFLNQYHGEDVKVESLTLNEASREILGTLLNEWEKTMPFLYVLSSFGVVDFSDYTSGIKKVIEGAFAHLPIVRILLPKDMSASARIQGIKDILEKEIFLKI